MMTLEEIRQATINPEVAREAHAQAQKRLEDALVTKASHEQKAFALLAAYITVALGLFSVFGIAAAIDRAVNHAFLVVGALYVFGAVLCGFALWPLTYGVPGSDPSAWLRRGVIDGGENALSANLAYETFFHSERIQSSAQANRRKARFIRVGIAVGTGAPILLGAWMWFGT